MPRILNVLGKVSKLCRLRGFVVEKSCIFPGHHATNGAAGNNYNEQYDYGPLGVELKRNVANEWWHEIVTSQENIYGVDLSVLNELQSGASNLTNDFNTSSSPQLDNYFTETCTHAVKYMEYYGFQMPFGLAQNIKIQSQHTKSCEVDQFIFQSKQKEFLKLCFFCLPNKLNFWMDYWMRKRLSWWKKFADIPAGFSLVESATQGLFPIQSNPSLTDTISVEVEFPWGKEAVESISSYRSVRDLIKTDLPNKQDLGVLVATLSVERGILAYLLDAFQEKETVNNDGVVSQHNILRLHPVLASNKVAVISSDLSNSDLCYVAHQLATELRQAGIPSNYMKVQDVAECYLRQDEVGTPYCVTTQDSTLTNGIVTLRNRDTTLSEFLHISEILKTVQRHLDSI